MAYPQSAWTVEALSDRIRGTCVPFKPFIERSQSCLVHG